jgi:hypothetical protein
MELRGRSGLGSPDKLARIRTGESVSAVRIRFNPEATRTGRCVRVG